MKRIRIGWALCGAMLGMALSAVTAFAAPQAAATHVGGDQQTVSATRGDRTVIKLLDPYVVRTADGALALQAPSSVSAAVGAATIAKVQSGLAYVNGEIRAGRLAATADHRLYDPSSKALSVQGGWTGLRWYWWGFDMYLSEYYTQKFEAALMIGTGILALCMAIPAIANQAACAGLGAACVLLGGWMWWVDNGNGDVFEKAWWSIGTFYGQ